MGGRPAASSARSSCLRQWKPLLRRSTPVRASCANKANPTTYLAWPRSAISPVERRGRQLVAQLMGQEPPPHVTPQPRAVDDLDRVFRQRGQLGADIVDETDDPVVGGIAQAI